MSYYPYYYSKYNNLTDNELLNLLDAQHKTSPIIRELMNRLEATEGISPADVSEFINSKLEDCVWEDKCKECESKITIDLDFDGNDFTVEIK